MTDRGPAYVLNNATSQLDRLLGAPKPGRVEVDGRNLAQLIAFAAQYGALVAFYDLENRIAGDWEGFFAGDPAVAEALHAALDLIDIDQNLQALLAELRAAKSAQHCLTSLQRLLAALARLLGILDRVYVAPGDAEVLVERFSVTVRIDGIGEPLRRLRGHLEVSSVEVAVMRGFNRGPRWWGELCDIVEDLAATLIAELRKGVAGAGARLDASLESGGHAPQAAVYNAFAVLFAEARTALNHFPERLVRFYYGEVLGQSALAPEPSRLFLAFTRASGAEQASVPLGAEFPAGSDSDGKPITYRAESALEVTPAVVSEISVRRVVRDRHGRLPDPLGVMRGIVALDPGKPGQPTPFPMFGTDISGSFDALEMQAAPVGFCVAGPLLTLLGGTRTIVIDVRVSLRRDRSAEPQRSGSIDLADGLDAVQAGLTLHYSTAGGWVPVQEFDVRAVPQAVTGTWIFAIAFTLPPDAPSVQPLDAKAPPGAPPPPVSADTFPSPPGQPAVTANIDADAMRRRAAFALLSRVWFDEITVEVAVSGLDGLTLTTPNGPADTSQNFALLGLPPTQGASLDIYAPELFVKPIETLSVAVDWVGLPITSTGFEGYYGNYVIDPDGRVSPVPLFDNTSFRIAFSVVNPGCWGCDSTIEPYLFQTGGPAPGSAPTPTPGASGPYWNPVPAPAGPVAPTSLLTVPGLVTNPPPPYYKASASALRLTLTQPSYAFGNVLYSNNLMYASQNAVSASTPLPSGSSAMTPSSTAAVQLRNLASVNASTPDKEYRQKVAGAVEGAVSALANDALWAVMQAVGQSGAPAAEQSNWLQDLQATLNGAVRKGRSFWSRFGRRGGVLSDAIAFLDRLRAWIGDHEQAIGQGSVSLDRAKTLLGTATTVAAAQTACASRPPAMARPHIAAATQQALAVTLPPALPNAPWLPMASALTVNYSAALSVAINAPLGASARPPVSGASSAGTTELSFWHIGPFQTLQPPSGSSAEGASLLPPVDDDAALYIQLSEPVSPVSLLFVLSAGPDGWWSDPPAIVWEQRFQGGWVRCTVLGDSTDGLKNSGIVTLAPRLERGAAKAPRLRARAKGPTHNAPLVQSVTANALTASWTGPGGASQQGVPLAAGTISKSASPLPGVASIVQPAASFGGAPSGIGVDFDKWMAERLRHKGFAIDAWDYARLALQAAPSLWQAVVVQATDETTGGRAPGKVWVVVVAGPATPNVTDPTVPEADLATLSSVGELLRELASPFAEIAVTNPPYLRLKVKAIVEFSGENTSAFWIGRLEAELTTWLSPWPDPSVAGRPRDYYTHRAVAEFVRHRPYVRAIIRLELHSEPSLSSQGYCYFTSALAHDISAAPPAITHSRRLAAAEARVGR